MKNIEYIYNELYINYNLKNFLLHPQEFYEIKFIPIKNVTTHYENLDWNKCKDNIYIQTYIDNKKMLGYDILKNGTYWPYSVYRIGEEKYLFQEGKHRYNSLKLIKELDPNYKMCCIILPSYFAESKIKKIYPLNSLYSFYNFYREENGMLKYYKKSADYCFEMYSQGIHKPATILKDKIFQSPYYIKPSLILNSEKEFNKWRNSFNQ